MKIPASLQLVSLATLLSGGIDTSIVHGFRPSMPVVSSNLFGTRNRQRHRQTLKAATTSDQFIPPPGWRGGFVGTNADFAYPNVSNPNTITIPYTSNKQIDNIRKITRWQNVTFPEFSWCVTNGIEASRIYTRFDQNISRVGYDNSGRIWSIVCPQKSWPISNVGHVTLEATVNYQRGWVDEPNKLMYGQLSVSGYLWIDFHKRSKLLKKVASILHKDDGMTSAEATAGGKEPGKGFFYKFPFNKANAMYVPSHTQGDCNQPAFPLITGNDPGIPQPNFTLHFDESFDSSHMFSLS